MKLIQLPHKVCGKTCMVNGLEDLYEWKTGNRLSDWLLFYLSGKAGFAYIKNKKSPAPRMIFWGATTQQQYETLKDVVGFKWSLVEGRSYSYAFGRAKEYVDQGVPVILGALDMYHLPYHEKFYHNFHVPIHYVLMVGYDDEQEAVLVHDCDRAEIQKIPYQDLQLAWNVNVPGLSKKNTLFTLEFDGQTADVATIVHEGLRKKANFMLEPPVSMFGIKGIRKLARELLHWSEELSEEQFDASLRHLVEYTGFPPAPPNRLTGYTVAPDNHTGARDGFANLLTWLAKDYNRPVWAKAAVLFEQSGQTLEEMTDVIVDFILGECDTLESVSRLVAQVANLEEQAYTIIATSEREA
jgi:hypothetical protein